MEGGRTEKKEMRSGKRIRGNGGGEERRKKSKGEVEREGERKKRKRSVSEERGGLVMREEGRSR